MIPDFQSIFLPLLKLTADGQEHTISDVSNKLAECFKLTEEQ